jgi:hypothetical protein
MFYCTVIIHLFRPMLKLDIVDSDVSPRDICIDMANTVSELLRTYRRSYDLRACTLVLTHILLSVSIVHLIFPQNSNNSSNFIEGLRALEDMSVCHYFGARSYKIVHSLAKTWNLPWPEELELSKLTPKVEASLHSGESLFHSQPAPPPQETTTNKYADMTSSGIPPRRESLSLFATDYQSPGAPSNPTSSMQSPPPFAEQHHHLTQQPQQTPTAFQFAPNSMPISTGAASTSEHADTLFWTPAPNFGLPILPRDFNTGPMDLNNMLANANEWERFGRDGFKMSEAWPTQELAMGYGNAMANPNVGMGDALGTHETAPAGDTSAYATTTNATTYSDISSGNTGDHSMAASGTGYQSWWNSGDAPSGNGLN